MKLSKEELQKVQSNQQISNEIIFAIGELELQKIGLVDQYRELAQQQNELGSDLTKKYGDGKINLSTGEITPIEPENLDSSKTS
jgi:hypothetical protein